MPVCGSRVSGSASASPPQLPQILQVNQGFGNKNLSCLPVSHNEQIQTAVRVTIIHVTSVEMKPGNPDRKKIKKDQEVLWKLDKFRAKF